MRSNFTRLTLVLAIMALPALPGPFMVRMGILLVCSSVAIALGVRWFGQHAANEPSRPAIDARAATGRQTGQGAAVHQLSHQLREVVQQTENAALEINERVINIIGRARAQLKAVTEVVNGLARDGNGGGTGAQRELTRVIESLDAEAASLSRDVNGVILSLQFQDLTKQRLEHVIHELHGLHDELELLRSYRGDAHEAASRSQMPDVRNGRPEAPRAQGRNDG